MLLTERQARGDDGQGGVMCPMSAGAKPIPCRGSRCAWWVWHSAPGLSDNLASDRPRFAEPVGHCGLIAHDAVHVQIQLLLQRRTLLTGEGDNIL